MLPNIDLHIHTTYSDGKCTLGEIVEEAKNQGLDSIAFTDHGFGHTYGVFRKRFEEFLNEAKLIKENSDIDVLVGIEAEAYHLDTVMDYRKDLDFILLSNHIFRDKIHLYRVVLEKMKRYDVDAIAHPYFKNEDLEEAIEVASNRGVSFEINNQRYVPDVKVIRQAAREGVTFTIGSDAHDRHGIGKTDWAYKVIKNLGIEESLIDVDRLVGK